MRKPHAGNRRRLPHICTLPGYGGYRYSIPQKDTFQTGFSFFAVTRPYEKDQSRRGASAGGGKCRRSGCNRIPGYGSGSRFRIGRGACFAAGFAGGPGEGRRRDGGGTTSRKQKSPMPNGTGARSSFSARFHPCFSLCLPIRPAAGRYREGRDARRFQPSAPFGFWEASGAALFGGRFLWACSCHSGRRSGDPGRVPSRVNKV